MIGFGLEDLHEMLRAYSIATTYGADALDNIHEFSNVTRPAVAEQEFHALN
jgi:hypothetical protein